nr:NAD+ synthase [Chitinispirillaceae bacterium]
MKITLCQYNPVVGDVPGNTARVCEALATGAQAGADLVVFPELFIQGYPPRDLLEQPWFIDQGTAALETIRACSEQHPETGVIVGTAMPGELPFGKQLHNAAVLVANGKILLCQPKSLLPSYDVFDETRYFDPAVTISVLEFKGEKLGISICEDAWNHEDLRGPRRYNRDPIAELAAQGATLLINIAASPFHMGKMNLRAEIARNHAAQHAVPFLYVNQVGGNDELVFDGASMVFDGEGALRARLSSFTEDCVTVDTRALPEPVQLPAPDTIAAVHDALVLGIRDYTRKCGFSSAVLGLSGGVDSALTCALAVQALGAENVWGVAMPSRYSSEGSVIDARKLADNCEIKFSVIPIEQPFAAFGETLAPVFAGTEAGLAEENLQARIRGTILMALSNKFGCLLLTTGNKSELAVGYCTLYGDMNGGLAVISDLPKGMVYKLSHHVNERAGREIIPAATIT